MNTPSNNTFITEVLEGLKATPKQLSSKYFYDEIGDKLFQRIMQLPEYYLTRTETKILEHSAENIISAFTKNQVNYLVELGAGDGTKTNLLLNQIITQNANITYQPIDISSHILNELRHNLHKLCLYPLNFLLLYLILYQKKKDKQPC